MKTRRPLPRALSTSALVTLAGAISVAASAGAQLPNRPPTFDRTLPTASATATSTAAPFGSQAAAERPSGSPVYTLSAYIKPENLPPVPWPASATFLPPGTLQVKSSPTQAVAAASSATGAQSATSSSDPPAAWVGTKGKGIGVEAFSVTPGWPWPTCLALETMAHVPGVGDTGWLEAPARIGTVGASKFIEGVAFRLSGACANQYAIKYNCHLKDLGDQTMMSSPDLCGTRGQGRPLEAFVVYITPAPVVQQAPASTPGKSTIDFLIRQFDFSIGPDLWLGTRGQGVQLASMAVKPGPTTGAAPWPACLKMKYMAHLSNVGDTGWYDAPSPVQGGFEGVAFKLEGTCAASYVVEYQCWVQGIGDVPLTTGPAFCGTRGQGRRLEAIRLTVRKR